MVAGVTGGGADSRPMEALALVAESSTATNVAEIVAPKPAKAGATPSSQAIRTFRLRANGVPLQRAFEGHSGPLVTAKPAANHARTRRFEQFPS